MIAFVASSRICILSVFVTLLTSGCAGASPSAVPQSAHKLPAAQARAIDRFVSQFTDLAMFDGVVLVDIGGEVVYRQAFGYANFELGVRHTQEHRFRIASVSKAVTDTAIAKLVEAGRLQLDTPIAKFLPNFPSADEIAVRHLLDHTSGIPHTNRQVWGDGTLSLSTTEIIDRLALLPLDFPPGSQSRYSNGGYAVAARILELIDNTTLTEALRRALLRPLGMNSTGHLADSRVAVPNLVTGYEPGKVPGQRRYPRFYAVESRPGGGSLYSTVDDLLRFTRAVFREDYVPAQWRRDVLGADDDVYLSQGRSPGFVAKLFYRASDDMIVISLANNYAVPADWTAAIAGLASSAPIETGWIDVKVVDKLIPVNHPMIGEYSNSFGGGQVSIKRTGEGHLTVTYGNENRATALVPLADGAFLLPLYFQRCHQPKPRGVISCHMLSGNKRYDSILTPR